MVTSTWRMPRVIWVGDATKSAAVVLAFAGAMGVTWIALVAVPGCSSEQRIQSADAAADASHSLCQGPCSGADKCTAEGFCGGEVYICIDGGWVYDRPGCCVTLPGSPPLTVGDRCTQL